MVKLRLKLEKYNYIIKNCEINKVWNTNLFNFFY